MQLKWIDGPMNNEVAELKGGVWSGYLLWAWLPNQIRIYTQINS